MHPSPSRDHHQQNLPYQDKLDPWSSHTIIAGMLEPCPPGTRVLDVGAASGTIGRLCQGRGLLLSGIEPVAAWAEAARPYYQSLCVQDLHRVEEDFIGGHQVVICADVLEHLPDPQSQLARLVQLQPPGAIFMISIPNVANLWVRISLLFGRFDYTERGILDRTHLRFFTYRSLLQMVSDAGLRVERVNPTPIPLNLVSPFFSRSWLGRGCHRLLAALTRLFPSLLGYQFVVYAVKSS